MVYGLLLPLDLVANGTESICRQLQYQKFVTAKKLIFTMVRLPRNLIGHINKKTKVFLATSCGDLTTEAKKRSLLRHCQLAGAQKYHQSNVTCK